MTLFSKHPQGSFSSFFTHRDSPRFHSSRLNVDLGTVNLQPFGPSFFSGCRASFPFGSINGGKSLPLPLSVMAASFFFSPFRPSPLSRATERTRLFCSSLQEGHPGRRLILNALRLPSFPLLFRSSLPNNSTLFSFTGRRSDPATQWIWIPLSPTPYCRLSSRSVRYSFYLPQTAGFIAKPATFSFLFSSGPSFELRRS